jgi:hypothetical protein
MPHSLECPRAFVPFGPGSHRAEQAALDLTVVHRLPWFQGLTLNTWFHGVLLANWQWRKEVTQRPRHLLLWHHFFSGLQGTLHHGNECLKKLPLFTSVSWYSWSFGASESYLTLKTQKFTYTRILNTYGTYPLCGCVCMCVGVWVVVKYFLYQCLLGTDFQILQVNNTSWKSHILGLPQRCYSKDQP